MKKISILLLITILLVGGCTTTKKESKEKANPNKIVLNKYYIHTYNEEYEKVKEKYTDAAKERIKFINSKEGVYVKEIEDEKYEFTFTYTKDTIDINNVGYYKYKIKDNKLYLDDKANNIKIIFERKDK